MYNSEKIIRGLQIENLMVVDRNVDDKIDEEYLIKLINYMNRTGAKAAKVITKTYKEERRKLHEAEDWYAYENTIMEAIECEKEAEELVVREILEALDIKEDDFTSRMQELYERDEMTAQRLEKA